MNKFDRNQPSDIILRQFQQHLQTVYLALCDLTTYFGAAFEIANKPDYGHS